MAKVFFLMEMFFNHNKATNAFSGRRLTERVRSPKTWFLAISFFLLWSGALAQRGGEVDFSGLQAIVSLDSAGFAVWPAGSKTEADVRTLDFSHKIPPGYRKLLPATVVNATIYIRFIVINSSPQMQEAYFYPGEGCRKLVLIGVDLGDTLLKNMHTLGPDSAPQSNFPGFQIIKLQPKEKDVLYAKLNFAPFSTDDLNPSLIRGDFLPNFRTSIAQFRYSTHWLNYLSVGMLLMMILYSITIFLQNNHIEFLYYAGYAGCMALYLSLQSSIAGTTSAFATLFDSYLEFIIKMTGVLFYVMFFKKFLDTRHYHPFLQTLLTINIIVNLTGIALFTLLYFTGAGSVPLSTTENGFSIILLLISIVFVFYGIKKNQPLLNFLVTGQIMITMFAFVAIWLTIYADTIRVPATFEIFINPIFYFQLGLILQMFFFMAGLSYKNKQDLIERLKEREKLKLDNERKEFEKQVAILEAKQQERNRISADMHDELGSGVTAIRLMSEIVKTKMKETTLPEIEKISNSANELINKLNTIIWTMVSANDTLESLIAYIRAYAMEFFENTSVECHFNLPAEVPVRELSGEKRRNIFLSVKESLNNVLKHARATQVVIDVYVTDKLLIVISDNGIGINLENASRFGNGMHNMKKRISSIAGHFRIENHEGTRATIELPL